MVDADLLVTAEQIGERAGVRPQAVHNWVARHDDFPTPIKVYGTMNIWYLPDVEDWLTVRGKI